MTTTQSRFFDELAKLMTNAAGAAQGVRREIDTLVQGQVERLGVRELHSLGRHVDVSACGPIRPSAHQQGHHVIVARKDRRRKLTPSNTRF